MDDNSIDLVTEIIQKVDYSKLEPVRVDVVDGVFHKYFSGDDMFQVNMKQNSTYTDFLGNKLIVSNAQDNIGYFVGGKCPDNMPEIGELFVKVEQSDHCKSATVSMLFAGLALGAVSFGLGMHFGQSKDMVAGLSFTPPLFGALVGAFYSGVCNYNYPDSHQAIWQEVKTCLVEEKIIGDGPIPIDSF
jgi:hypothetical protein